ncbi:MAG: tRNA (guanosine(37)-N1)-methyltransferase TrmD, partial [Candidatus Adiutrix sp.]
MLFHIITIFPHIFTSFLGESLLAKAIKQNIIKVRLMNPRDFTQDRHQSVDDRPYGGGPGMVLRPQPISAAIDAASAETDEPWRIYLSPSGGKLTQAKVKQLAARKHLILVCGRYEGLDRRVIDLSIDEEISIGDYVVNGGEVPAMVLIEAISRLLPRFMGKMESADEESHQRGLLEYPHYTRPPEFNGLKVPAPL